MERCRPIEQPRSFLFRIAKHIALSQLTRKARQITEYIEDSDDSAVIQTVESAEEEASARQTLGLHCEAVAELAPRCRHVYLQPSFYAQQSLSIRGVSSGYSSHPTVGVIVDDVPFGGSTIQTIGYWVPDLDPGDLSRVEVLRGPQGTLYRHRGRERWRLLRRLRVGAVASLRDRVAEAQRLLPAYEPRRAPGPGARAVNPFKFSNLRQGDENPGTD